MKYAALVLLLSSVFTGGLAHAGFDLKKSGTQVCKIEGGQDAQICYVGVAGKVLKVIGLDAVTPDVIEIVDEVARLNKQLASGQELKSIEELTLVGSGLTLNSANRLAVVSQFKRLSVRNLAVQPRAMKVIDGYVVIPFIGSVYWIDHMGLQGTINFEGGFRLKKIGDTKGIISLNEDPEILNKSLANLFDVQGISDSSTEQRIEALRVLEAAARGIHFANTGKGIVNADSATVALIENIIGPAIIGKVLLVPTLESFVRVLTNL